MFEIPNNSLKIAALSSSKFSTNHPPFSFSTDLHSQILSGSESLLESINAKQLAQSFDPAMELRGTQQAVTCNPSKSFDPTLLFEGGSSYRQLPSCHSITVVLRIFLLSEISKLNLAPERTKTKISQTNPLPNEGLRPPALSTI